MKINKGWIVALAVLVVSMAALMIYNGIRNRPLVDIRDSRLCVFNRFDEEISARFKSESEFNPPFSRGSICPLGVARQYFLSGNLQQPDADVIAKALYDYFSSLGGVNAVYPSLDQSNPLFRIEPCRWVLNYHGKETDVEVSCYVVGSDGSSVLLTIRETLKM